MARRAPDHGGVLHQTIFLLVLSLLLLLLGAIAALRGLRRRGGLRLAWGCLLLAAASMALRSAMPLWIALQIGLYDYLDAVLAFAGAFCLCCAAIALSRQPVGRGGQS